MTFLVTGVGAFEHFITRDGDRLMDGDKEFRFIGANMPGLNLPYDYFYGLPERMILPDPWEQEDAFKTCTLMGLTCVRTWNLPIARPDEKVESVEAFKAVLRPRQFNEKAFVAMDHLLALANKYKVRVMLSLGADCGDYLGGITDYAAHRGMAPKEFYTDELVKADYKATLDFVLNRVNTVTGVPYKNDKAIMAWQFGNEFDRVNPGEEERKAWQAEMAAHIKSIDKNHLISYARRFFPTEPDKNIDIIVYHYYGGDWDKLVVEHRKRTEGLRPFIVGEFGLEARPEKVESFLNGVIEQKIAGAMIWSMSFHHRNGGFWHHGIFTGPGMKTYHWPGFPENDLVKEREILAALRNAAFKIRGLDVPPISAPEKPVLLPFEKQALMSWKGSAGAASYRVERAEKIEGPWQLVAENISDGDIVSRPLFADKTAYPGQTVFYRVLAVNEGGVSPPSNVVGPVKIERGVLVDEMKNFDLCIEHSESIALEHTKNHLYAEHYYRMNGKFGDVLVYEIPEGQEVDAVNVDIWSNSFAPVCILRVSNDKQNWMAITGEVSTRKMIPYYDDQGPQTRATETRYRVTEIPGSWKYVRVGWGRAGLLDRVEIFTRTSKK